MVKNRYCGINNVPKGKIRGTLKECAESKQLRFYGKHKISDSDLKLILEGKIKQLGFSPAKVAAVIKEIKKSKKVKKVKKAKTEVKKAKTKVKKSKKAKTKTKTEVKKVEAAASKEIVIDIGKMNEEELINEMFSLRGRIALLKRKGNEYDAGKPRFDAEIKTLTPFLSKIITMLKKVLSDKKKKEAKEVKKVKKVKKVVKATDINKMNEEELLAEIFSLKGSISNFRRKGDGDGPSFTAEIKSLKRRLKKAADAYFKSPKSAKKHRIGKKDSISLLKSKIDALEKLELKEFSIPGWEDRIIRKDPTLSLKSKIAKLEKLELKEFSIPGWEEAKSKRAKSKRAKSKRVKRKPNKYQAFVKKYAAKMKKEGKTFSMKGVSAAWKKLK